MSDVRTKPGFSASTTVDRPIEAVFAFLADGENDKEWAERLIEIRKTTPGEVGVGTAYASTARDMGVKAKHETRLTVFEPPTRLRWEEVSRGPIYIAEGGYDLAPAADGGTELTLFNRLEAKGLGKLLLGNASRGLRKRAPDVVRRIKAAIEAS